MLAELVSDTHAPTLKINQLAQDVALLQPGVALVDIIEFDVTGDQVIELQMALLPRIQQSRHINPEPVAAHGGS